VVKLRSKKSGIKRQLDLRNERSKLQWLRHDDEGALVRVWMFGDGFL
jgi:hypothetical protein